MLADVGIGEIIAKGLSKIFKDRPYCGYAIFIFLIVVVLGGMIFGAKNPDDLVFPILGLTFVLIVVVGRAFGAIRKRRNKEYQATNQAELEQEEPNDHETIKADPEAQMNVTPLVERQATQITSAKKGNFRQVLIVCVIFFALGYLVAYLLDTTIFAKLLTQIIPNWTVSQAITDLKSIRMPFLQIICGFPIAFVAFLPILAILYIMIIRNAESNIKMLWITHAILSFICGILIFGPIQVLLLFGGSI